ncbi:MAG: FAD-containing monooxygenase EthA [Hydrocarboniphaga sp.]|nr:FAD-containing monooxygenase EthA [Hydrocarboniphaga sp.]
MLQRSPSYVFSLPNRDAISELLAKFLPQPWVHRMARQRNILIQRVLYQACRRWPKIMRKWLLGQVRKHVGPDFDMRHFTPSYMPWDERLCAVPDAGILDALRSGYVQRSKATQPRQGSKLPWRVLNHFGRDRRMLQREPVDDGVLDFSGAVDTAGACSCAFAAGRAAWFNKSSKNDAQRPNRECAPRNLRY